MMEERHWLFLGDSLIEFGEWGEMFPTLMIDNRGVAGETVGGLLARLEVTADSITAPELILIMSGINNVAMEDFTFLATYEKVVQLLAARFPQAAIFVNCLLPVRLPWFSEDTVPRVNSLLQQLARRTGVEFLDIYQSFTDDRGRIDAQCFLEDGVHLSPHGYRVWAAALTAFLLYDRK
jgi:lysophospholipase L1-like esterase